jgi:glycosyltransferase involved in cell wall biosynthesis
MKISMLTPWKEPCGIAEYSRFLKSALEGVGLVVEVVPFTVNKKKSDFVNMGKRLSNADIAHIQYEHSFFSNARDYFAVHFGAAWHLYILLRQLMVRNIISIHEFETPLGQGPRSRLVRYAQSKILAQSDAIIVHTTSLSERLLSLGIREDRIIVLPHPIPEMDPSLLTEDMTSYKRALGIENRNVLTIFGFVTERKGYGVALEAMTALDDSVLLIAGGPHPKDRSNYYEKIIQRITELNLTGKVKVLGFLSNSEVCKVLLSTDIVLAPFYSCTGSGSLSFAATFHKPIIASDIQTMKELNEMGLGMELFRTGDSAALIEKTNYLMRNNAERQRLIEMNRQYSRRYSYSNFAREMSLLYEKFRQ